MDWPTKMVGASLADWAWRGKPNQWLSPLEIVKGLDGVAGEKAAGINLGATNDEEKDRVCVIVGREDMMYRPAMWERMCKEYRDALGEVRGRKNGSSAVESMESSNKIGEPIEGVSVERGDGVRLILVEDSGHHVQNDVRCDEAAEAFLRWANQV